MLGTRGVRLGILMPANSPSMQVRAIFEAACEVTRRKASTCNPEVMIPLTMPRSNELEAPARRYFEAEAEGGHGGARYLEIAYKFGTMIETPPGSSHRR